MATVTIRYELRQIYSYDSLMMPFTAVADDQEQNRGFGIGRTCEEAEQVAIQNLQARRQMKNLPPPKTIEI